MKTLKSSSTYLRSYDLSVLNFVCGKFLASLLALFFATAFADDNSDAAPHAMN